MGGDAWFPLTFASVGKTIIIIIEKNDFHSNTESPKKIIYKKIDPKLHNLSEYEAELKQRRVNTYA